MGGQHERPGPCLSVHEFLVTKFTINCLFSSDTRVTARSHPCKKCIRSSAIGSFAVHERCNRNQAMTAFFGKWDQSQLVAASGVASPKFVWGANLLTFSEQHYFVWDTASQSTKWQDMLEIWGGQWSPYGRNKRRGLFFAVRCKRSWLSETSCDWQHTIMKTSRAAVRNWNWPAVRGKWTSYHKSLQTQP